MTKRCKVKIIRVTIEEDYLIEMHDDEVTRVNGWTMDEVVADWFRNKALSGSHAARDGHLIGNSRKYIEHREVDLGKED